MELYQVYICIHLFNLSTCHVEPHSCGGIDCQGLCSADGNVIVCTCPYGKQYKQTICEGTIIIHQTLIDKF